MLKSSTLTISVLTGTIPQPLCYPSKITSSERLKNCRQTNGARKREDNSAEELKCPNQGIGPAFCIWAQLERVC